MIIRFSKQKIRKKSKNRPKGYFKELISIAIKQEGNYFFFDTEGKKWEMLKIKYRNYTTGKNVRKAPRKKIYNASKKKKRRGGCGCGG